MLSPGPDIEALEKKIEEIDKKIKDVEKRLPAHSVKPPIMTELFELEDAREALVKKIAELKNAGDE
jgi:prefoldin subunit 5